MRLPSSPNPASCFESCWHPEGSRTRAWVAGVALPVRPPKILTVVATLLGALVVAAGGIQVFQADRTLVGILIAGTPIPFLFFPLAVIAIVSLAKRCRRALAISLLSGIGLSAICGLQVRIPSNDQGDFTVATYNIEHGLKGLDKVVDAIREIDPDIAILQEATMKWEPQKRTLKEFEESLPEYEYTFSEDRIVLSRFPILDSRFEWLGPRKSRKRVQLATVRIGDRTVTMANVHMLPSDPRSKWPEIVAHRADEYADLFRVLGGLTGPVILGGDFNGIAHGPNYARICETMRDAFAASGSGFGFTVPTELPMRRIDMLFATSELRPVRSWVGSQTASDHRPVVAAFRWEQGPEPDSAEKS
mgnify:FL=1